MLMIFRRQYNTSRTPVTPSPLDAFTQPQSTWLYTVVLTQGLALLDVFHRDRLNHKDLQLSQSLWSLWKRSCDIVWSKGCVMSLTIYGSWHHWLAPLLTFRPEKWQVWVGRTAGRSFCHRMLQDENYRHTAYFCSALHMTPVFWGI